jgi:hypothetical protein
MILSSCVSWFYHCFVDYIYFSYLYSEVIQRRFSPDGREDVVIVLYKDFLFST